MEIPVMESPGNVLNFFCVLCPGIWNLWVLSWKYPEILCRYCFCPNLPPYWIFFLIYQLVDVITIAYVYFLRSVHYFLAFYPDLLEIICMLFPSLNCLLPNLASHLTSISRKTSRKPMLFQYGGFSVVVLV